MIKLSFEEDEIPSKVGIYLFGMPMIFYTKCHVLDKFYGNAAKYFTKHKLNRSGSQRPMFHGSNMVVADSDDPEYKKKRKAVSEAFLKNKMDKNVMTVKQSVMKSFYDFQQQGDENTVDLNTFTSKV